MKYCNYKDIVNWSKEILSKEYDIKHPSYGDFLSFYGSIYYCDEIPSKEDISSNLDNIKNDFLVFEDGHFDDEDLSIIYCIISDENKNENLQFIQKKLNYIEDLNDEFLLRNNIKIIFFTYVKPNQTTIENIQNEIIQKSNIKIEIEYIQFSDIIQHFNNNKNALENVPSFDFDLDANNNILKLKSDNSFIVNVSAKSIKKVYQNFGKNCGPLYNSNLRFYIKNKKIDDSIRESITKDSNNFWHYNNGIVIICNKFKFNESLLTLENFTFINGGQTTFNIGETDFDKDFFVMTKIICLEGKDDTEIKEIIEKISIATNSQKPIKECDLLANKPIIQSLSKLFYEDKISLYGSYFLKTKRGQRSPKLNLNEKYKMIDLKQLGQLGICILLFMPGSAKNALSKMYSKQNMSIIFDNRHVEEYKGLRKLWCSIEKIRKDKIKVLTNEGGSKDIIKIYKVSQWFIFAALVFSNIYYESIEFRNILNLDDIRNNTKLISEYIQINSHLLTFNNNYIESDLDNSISTIVSIMDNWYETKADNDYANTTKNDADFLNFFLYLTKRLLDTRYNNLKNCCDGLFKC